ncbi:MAG: methyltransferase domain-containing protein [Alphaproteobacteria bacterium]
MLGLIGPPAGRRILDVGCGDGALTLELAARGARAVGVDSSAAMVAAANGRAAAAGAGVTFETGKAEALPFEAGTFDVVVAVTVLCFVGDTTRAVAEMARVLKPGGRLVVGELGRWSSWAALRRIRGWLGSPVWRRARFRSAGDLRRLVDGAGLTGVSVTGAVFYPPCATAARLGRPMDARIGRCTTAGAAFLALAATKPCQTVEHGRTE